VGGGGGGWGGFRWVQGAGEACCACWDHCSVLYFVEQTIKAGTDLIFGLNVILGDGYMVTSVNL